MANPNIEQQIDSLRSDIAGIRSQLSDVVDSARRTGSGAAEALRERLKGFEAGDQLEHLLDDAMRMGKDSVESVEHHIEEHPYLTIAAAFGIGFLLSAMLRR